MSLDVRITYKDPTREKYWHPFCLQVVLTNYWWPIAARFSLKTLQRLEVLHITDRDDAAALIREMRVVESLLRESDRAGVPEDWARYMLGRLGVLLPVFDATLVEWDAVESLSL